MTSEREGTSNSLLEAMQAGCPIFATSAGDNRLLLGEPPCGETGDPRELIESLRHALETPGELDRLRRLAIARAAEFTVRRMANQTAALYHRVLAPAAAPALPESSRA